MPIVNASTSIYTATQSGVYSVQITDTNGCASKADFNGFNSVKFLTESSDIVVYPNPSYDGEFTVSMACENTTITVRDITGRKLQTVVATNKNTHMLIKDSGVYILEVKAKAQTVFRKILVQRTE